MALICSDTVAPPLLFCVPGFVTVTAWFVTDQVKVALPLFVPLEAVTVTL